MTITSSARETHEIREHVGEVPHDEQHADVLHPRKLDRLPEARLIPNTLAWVANLRLELKAHRLRSYAAEKAGGQARARPGEGGAAVALVGWLVA